MSEALHSMHQPSEAFDPSYTDIYAVLSSITQESRAVADELRPKVFEHVRRLVRAIDGLEQEYRRWQDLLVQLEALAAPDRALGVLRGRQLGSVALSTLREAGVGAEGIHYREWFRLVQAQGYRIGGRDPLATFLTAATRLDEVERLGARSGMYRLKSSYSTSY